MNVVTAEEMRRIDQTAIEERGIAAGDLMESAGRAIATGVADLIEPGPVVVLCGKGNNGGDGFVAARYLATSGYPVTVVLVLGKPDPESTAGEAFAKLPSAGVRILEKPDEAVLGQELEDADAVVDAILGTGAKGELRPPVDAVARLVNGSGLPVIAADIPTGLDADTGEGELIIRAALTVTIGLPKLGMLTAAGVAVCGHVRVESIQFPADLLENPQCLTRTTTLAEAALLLPPRPIDSHKGTHGTLTVCAGSRGMPGASVLCGMGALRSGVGLLRMHVPDDCRATVSGHLPEAILSQVPAGGETLKRLSSDDFAELEENSEAFLIGPGCTTGESVAAFLSQLLDGTKKPVLLDADALNLIAADPDLRALLHENCLLTPHPGEAARLLKTSIADIQKNRWKSAARLAEESRCTVILKGFSPLVARPDGRVTHIPSGNSALARGGTGDMLSGIVSGLLAQGLPPGPAAILGTFAGGLASDILVRSQSPRGVTVREILAALPAAWRELEGAPGARPSQRPSLRDASL